MFLKHTRTNEAKFHQERIYNLLLNLNLNDRENIKKKNMKKTRGTTLPIHLTVSRPSYRGSSRSFVWLGRSWENRSFLGIHHNTFQEVLWPYSPLKSHMWTAKNSEEGNIPGSCPAVNQTHNQQRHALEFQPEFLEPAQEFKKTPSREAPQILPFQTGCRMPRQHFLQLAGAPTQKQITHPKGNFTLEALEQKQWIHQIFQGTIPCGCPQQDEV